MDEKMHFMTEPEELLNWMKEHEEFKVMNKEDAQILLNYMEGHDYRLGTDKDGSLVRVDINTDEYEAEPYSLDDVIDIVCEWNDELIRYTSQELNELSQGQDKSSLEVKLASLKQDEIRLDKMFEQTKYPAEIEALAVQLADAFIERLGLGYSYDEVKALKEHYRSEGAKLKSLEQEASKELKLAESIRKDFVGTDGQEVERQQEEVKEQNMEHEKQPRR